MTSDHLTIIFPRRLLEHPRALHIHRMRAAVWLYLALLARLPAGSDTVEVDPAGIWPGRWGFPKARSAVGSAISGNAGTSRPDR